MVKLTIEGEVSEILGAMDALINRGTKPQDFLDRAQMYADQAMASAGKADAAARNAEMALDEIKKEKT